jgi:lactoylglutathione lyase
MALRAFPVIYSHSVAAAAGFYGRLGFQETFRLPPEGEPGYVSLRRGDAELGIVSAEWPGEQLGIEIGSSPRFELFVYVDDVDTAVETFNESVLKEPEDMPWGERIAYIRDPDGNPVTLAALSVAQASSRET